MSSLTLVLLPGLEGSGNLFANLLSELPKDIKVIVVAYPHDKFLTYSELVLWLKNIVPTDDPYVLLGESFGSPLAVMFAATHPPNLKGVILSAGFISNPVRNWWIVPRILANSFFFQFEPPDFAIKYFIAGWDAPRNLLQAVRKAQRAVNVKVFARRAQATIDCNAREELRQVNVPLLYLQATKDNLVHKSSLEEIKRLHPQTIAVPIPAPHLLLQRQPREAAEAITRFLDAEGCYNS